MASDVHLRNRKNETLQAPERLPEMVEESEELQMYLSRMCVDISTFKYKNGEREKDETGVEERFLLRSGMSGVKSYSGAERVEMLPLLRYEVAEQVLPHLLEYDPKRMNRSDMEGKLCQLIGLMLGR